MFRKPVEIEQLLRWAYRDELPKARVRIAGLGQVSGGWDVMNKFADYLGLIDEPVCNGWGVVMAIETDEAPHPDAERVAAAVAGLDALDLDLPQDWNPFDDLGDLGELGPIAIGEVVERLTVREDGGRRRLRSAPSALMVRHALLGGCPVWEAETPELRYERCAVSGRTKWFVRKMIRAAASDTPFEVEVNGLCSVRRRPLPGAYRKPWLDPCLVEAGIGRGEYEIWRFALDVLVGELAGELEAHEATPSPRAARPWIDAESGPRVLPVLVRL